MYLLVTVHLFTKTENDEENAAVEKEAHSWDEDDRHAEGPRAHSSSPRVFVAVLSFDPGCPVPANSRRPFK